jgi:BirA family biotin operon repressor/biotin-[acetyl-CoA-carboxylase] ligase
MESNSYSGLKEIYLDSVDSTQVYARDYLKQNKSSSSLDKIVMISAEKQTKGIGREDRKWHSPESNLFLTFIIPMQKPDWTLLTSLPFVTSVSISHTLEFFGCATAVKWVNDVLIEKSKVAGILIESIQEADEVHILIGIGINVNMSKEDCELVDQSATSMKIVKGKSIDKNLVLEVLKTTLLKNIKSFNDTGFGKEYFMNLYNEKLAFKSKMVKIESKGQVTEGRLKGINSDGFLILHTESDEEKIVTDGRLFLIE